MKLEFNPKNISEQKVKSFLIVCYIASIFLIEKSLVLNRISLILLVLFSFKSFRKKDFKSLLKNPFLSFLFGSFIYSLLFLCNFNNVTLYLIFGLLFIAFKQFNSKERLSNLIYKTLNYSSILIFIICLIDVSIRVLYKEHQSEYWWNEFVHKSLISITELHPSYLSMFILATINWNFSLLLKEDKSTHLVIIHLIVLSAFLILIASKMALLLLALIILYYTYLILIKSKAKSRVPFLIGILTVVLLLFNSLPSIKNRVVVDYLNFKENQFQLDNNSRLSERIFLWKASLSGIYKSPLGNYCVDTKEIIHKENTKKVKIDNVKKNAHNNFLEFGLTYGVMGILFLLLFMFYLIKTSVTFNSSVLFISSVIFLFFSMVESTLVREMGVLFVALLIQLEYLKVKDK